MNILKLLISSSINSFTYGQDTVRGVNLGGWLVTEPWITPSIYEPYENQGVIDEHTLCKVVGKEKCLTILSQHWSTFVTEQDFVKIKEAGLNHVRIPIGFWAFHEQGPYVQGQIIHMKRALGYAKAHDIRVILDLHGAPGSQNGFDNSGQRLERQTWASNPQNIERTIETLKLLISTFKEYEDITSVAILNEPHGGQIDIKIIRDFYQKAVTAIRNTGAGQFLWLSDAFSPQDWTDITYGGSGIDSHFYHVFDYGILQAEAEDHKKVEQVVCSRKDQLMKSRDGKSNYQIPHIVGEWSAAVTDCAKWLNGIGKGTRWEGTYDGAKVREALSCSGKEDASTWSQEEKDKIRKYVELQMSVYEVKGGWTFWNFKTEKADAWNYLKGVDMGYIPRNPTQLTYKC